MASEPLWVLKGGEHTRAWTFGRGRVVLVRLLDHANPKTELPRVLEYHPGWAEGEWKAARGAFPVAAGPLCLFNSRDPLRPGL